MEFRFKKFPCVSVTVFLALFTFLDAIVFAQTSATDPVSRDASLVPQSPPTGGATAGSSSQASSALPLGTENDRIFGVIPNYLTVENPKRAFAPLTVEQKFELFAKETFDPFTFAASAGGAGISQAHNGDPKYGQGWGAYGDRFGAAVADVTTQNFFSDAVLASLWHEDPRYFRRGPEFGFWYRVGYAMSRVFVTKTDAGKDRVNYSGLVGMSMGIALSNAYYPDASVSGQEVASRFGTSLLASALSNILPEFWPDIHDKFLHRKQHDPPNQHTSQPPVD